jgi:ssDNA-binding Zn-finger/Zn-ribbon topoisomerase 1
MDVEFTAQLEESLDKIEEGDADWVDTVDTFYKQFARDLKSAGKKMENVKVGQETGDACPECGEPVVKKFGRFGSFLACSAYPECKYTKDVAGGREKPVDEPTDEVTRRAPGPGSSTGAGKFIACSGYPECKTTAGIGCLAPAVAASSWSGGPDGARLSSPHQLSDVHVRAVDTAGRRALPEVRSAVHDGTAGARREDHPDLCSRRVRLQARDRSHGRRVSGV